MIESMLLPFFIIAGFGEGTPQQGSIRGETGSVVESCSVMTGLIFKAIYATLLHSYTSRRVVRYEIMVERNMVNLTITMTKEERKALKQIALDKDMTVSALIRLWLQEQRKDEVKE